MRVADGENDAFGRDAERVFPTLFHEFADGRIIRAGIGDRPLDIGAFKVQFFDIQTFVSNGLLKRERKVVPLDAGDLNAGLCFKHLVIDKVAICNRSLERVVEGRHAVFAGEQMKRNVGRSLFRWRMPTSNHP